MLSVWNKILFLHIIPPLSSTVTENSLTFMCFIELLFITHTTHLNDQCFHVSRSVEMRWPQGSVMSSFFMLWSKSHLFLFLCVLLCAFVHSKKRLKKLKTTYFYSPLPFLSSSWVLKYRVCLPPHDSREVKTSYFCLVQRSFGYLLPSMFT